VALAAVCLLAALCSLHATNAPVFRHALERWPASDYEIVVFHRGELAGGDQALVDRLRAARDHSFANVAVKTVNVSGQMDAGMEELWTCQTNPLPPWVVVRAPDTSADAAPVWSGRLTESVAAALVDSPARRKIAEGLLRGVTAVWVLLECGEAARDEAAVDTLSAALKRLAEQMTLSKPAPGDPKLRSPLPLAVEFALVRITRTDPAEEFFVALLQHGQQMFAARPAAFPVYGRGRMLGAIVGREIDAASIEQACATIAGACSREAKEENPGRDLLLAANWNTIFEPDAGKNTVSASANRPSSPTPVVPAGAAQASAGNRGRWTTYLALAAALIVTAGFIALRLRRGQR